VIVRGSEEEAAFRAAQRQTRDDQRRVAEGLQREQEQQRLDAARRDAERIKVESQIQAERLQAQADAETKRLQTQAAADTERRRVQEELEAQRRREEKERAARAAAAAAQAAETLKREAEARMRTWVESPTWLNGTYTCMSSIADQWRWP
jgi:hypothetical protein